MLKKVFLITEFGSPFDWTEQYIKNIGSLGDTGWYWKIFTPNKYDNLPFNVEIIDMTAEQFADLTEKKTGVRPNMFTTKLGVPSVHITDFYVASGLIFEDYIKGFDFWGITNMDVVYGRLSRFVPDELLKECDIFSDDPNTINGIFCLFNNMPHINELFKKIPDWEKKFAQPACPKCLGEGGSHTLYGTDEYDLTKVARETSWLRFFSPAYYPMHSHDRLETQQPSPKLSLKPDGSLWELSEDIGHPNWEHARPVIGREVLLYHFCKTKKWPNIAL
jgi:hypothetical protein